MKILIIQQCWHCGRDLDRVLVKGTEPFREFIEDHPDIGLDIYSGNVRQIREGVYCYPLPETQCDGCIESYLDYKYGPE